MVRVQKKTKKGQGHSSSSWWLAKEEHSHDACKDTHLNAIAPVDPRTPLVIDPRDPELDKPLGLENVFEGIEPLYILCKERREALSDLSDSLNKKGFVWIAFSCNVNCSLHEHTTLDLGIGLLSVGPAAFKPCFQTLLLWMSGDSFVVRSSLFVRRLYR